MQQELDPHTKQERLWPSVMGMGGLLVLAGFAFLFITQGTPGFYRLSFYQALFGAMGLAVLLTPLTALLVVSLWLIRRKFTLPRWVGGKLFIRLGAFAFLCAVLFGLFEARPKTRLMRLTSGAAADARSVRVVGFNAFLSRRWLYSFDMAEEKFVALADALNLESSDNIDLKATLVSPHALMNSHADMVRDVPGKDASLAFSGRDVRGQSSTWITMVYSRSAKRAWLFSGYQN